MQVHALTCRHACVSLIAVTLFLTPGCIRVVRHEAPYYVDGPHQVEGPNGLLSEGTHVMVVGRNDSYSHILTFDGVSGYILTGSLATYSEWQQQKKQEQEELERIRELSGE
jgi:hypothetical protein